MDEQAWDWAQLDEDQRATKWRQLAEWVEWLQDHFDSWVTLPPCWPRHESLRSELAFFQGWHEEIVSAGSGYDGAQWHAQLRDAAAAWKALVNCKHEEAPWQKRRNRDPEVVKAHLDAAIRSEPDRSPKGPARVVDPRKGADERMPPWRH